MEPHLRAGVAIYDAGHFHAAHDAWEDRWLEVDEGDDERLLHGLIQFTAAVHHAREGNWEGAVGLAESAREYLADLPADYRGVNVGDVREYLAALVADPELVERRRPLALTYEGDVVALGDLAFPAVGVAAVALAEADDRYDEAVIERAAEYAERDVEDGEETTPFVALTLDFVTEPENRGIIYDRLGRHVERRRSREEDVAGLFD